MKQRALYIIIGVLTAVHVWGQKYEYDANYRLSKVTYSNGITVSYSYDALGNRTEIEVTGSSATVVENAKPYAVLSNDNTLLTFYYDDMMEERAGMEANIYPWIAHAKDIEKVIFDSSFDHCSTISNTSYWFYDCENLKEIVDIEYLHTDNVTDMEAMFSGCSSLKSIDVSHFNTTNVERMDWMFSRCYSLEYLDVSHFDTRNVVDMMSMFNDCSNLKNLDVSHFNTSLVDNMSQMFHSCYSLTSLDLTGFDTRNVTNMRHMLSFCIGIEKLDLSGFDTGKVTDMVCMFRGSSKLETITVAEGWNTSQVTDSEDMFDLCTSIVGGCGTTYDSDYTDIVYARIDGGTDSPGYLSILGDANGDGAVNAADIVEVINYTQGKASPDFSRNQADVNKDNVIDAADILLIEAIIMRK